MTEPITRRRLLLAAAAASALLAACATPPAGDTPPIVFVHGNGDTAALWTTTIWRFESNGWPRERLHAIDLPYPLARDDDAKEQPGRSSTAEHMAYLAAEVKKVLAATGAKKVALVGSSRGGNAIRNFVANGGGAALVSHAVLGGIPNHGVWANPAFLPGSEFNGKGPFLTALNAPRADGSEVTPGVAWMTIRSDNYDKFAQPDGAWIGARGTPTNVTFDGPALKGAENVVIAGIDHRETAFSAKAFARNVSLHRRPRAGDAGHRSGGAGRARRHRERPRPRQPARQLRDQPAARRRDGRGLRDERGDRRTARRCRAQEDDRHRRPLGAVRRRRQRALRIRHQRARLRDDARLPVAVPALFVDRQPAPRAARRRRPRREVARHADASARLLRRAARPHRARRHEPAGGDPERRRRRRDGARQGGRRRSARGRRRVQRRAHRRTHLAGRPRTTSSSSS